jgi:hypothetical protein
MGLTVTSTKGLGQRAEVFRQVDQRRLYPFAPPDSRSVAFLVVGERDQSIAGARAYRNGQELKRGTAIRDGTASPFAKSRKAA